MCRYGMNCTDPAVNGSPVVGSLTSSVTRYGVPPKSALSTGSFNWVTLISATVQAGVQLIDGEVEDETVMVIGSSHPPPDGDEESPQATSTTASANDAGIAGRNLIFTRFSPNHSMSVSRCTPARAFRPLH